MTPGIVAERKQHRDDALAALQAAREALAEAQDDYDFWAHKYIEAIAQYGK